jgi:predicted amidohydrolase
MAKFLANTGSHTYQPAQVHTTVVLWPFQDAMSQKRPRLPAGYQEKYYFSPGDTGFKVFQTRKGAIGVGICWDQVPQPRQPTAPRRPPPSAATLAPAHRPHPPFHPLA